MAIERVLMGGQMVAMDTDTGEIQVLIGGLVTIAQAGLLAGPDEISIDSTATGKTLATLLSKALETGLTTLNIYIQAAGVSYAAGNATAGVNDLGAGLWTFKVTKTQADTFKFVTASGTVKATVIQEG